MTEDQWYSNKDLYEMMVNLSKGLEKTNAELSKTQVMIRDYNGLRERLKACELKMGEGQGIRLGSREMWGYIIGAAGVVIALASFLTR